MLGWGATGLAGVGWGGAGWTGEGVGPVMTVAQHMRPQPAPAQLTPILLSLYNTNILIYYYTTTQLYYYTNTTIRTPMHSKSCAK